MHEPPELVDDKVNAGSDQARMVLRRVAKVSAPERRAVSTSEATTAARRSAETAGLATGTELLLG